MDKSVRAVDPKKVNFLFENCLQNNSGPLSKAQRQFLPYIKGRYTMQWGSMADGFDEFERREGISLELLKIFHELDYPLSISTKGTWFTKDPRYMNLIAKHRHNWHFKISIITSDPIKAKFLERGVDSPAERFEAIKRLSSLGVSVTLRLRPYMIGISDDWRETLIEGRKSGADSITTEFFCLEARADEKLKRKYIEMSKIAGYDVWNFYRDNSLNKSGYRRLQYAIKRPIIDEMKKTAHALNMRFYVSDAHCKEQSDFCCCCGVPPDRNVSKGHFAEALLLAKKTGIVYWKDIAHTLKSLVGDIPYASAVNFNTG